MTLDLDLIRAIDARVSAGATRITALGTVTAVHGFTDADVTFDGSTQSVPVKVGGDVQAWEGDRVCLTKYGVWWVVTDTLTRRWPSHAALSLAQTTGTTTSGAMADTPTQVQVPFIKRWDQTRVYVAVTGGAFSTIANTVAAWGAYFGTPSQPTIATYNVTSLLFNNASMHMSATGWVLVTNLIADTYTVTVRWARTSGTGTISCDAFDTVGIHVMEVGPT